MLENALADASGKALGEPLATKRFGDMIDEYARLAWQQGPARVIDRNGAETPHLIAGDPKAEGGRRVLFYSGDDAPAKADIGALIERLGFFGIDLGPLAVGGRLVQFPGGPLPVHNLVKFG